MYMTPNTTKRPTRNGRLRRREQKIGKKKFAKNEFQTKKIISNSKWVASTPPSTRRSSPTLLSCAWKRLAYGLRSRAIQTRSRNGKRKCTTNSATYPTRFCGLYERAARSTTWNWILFWILYQFTEIVTHPMRLEGYRVVYLAIGKKWVLQS